jgi:hypothetical protein
MIQAKSVLTIVLSGLMGAATVPMIEATTSPASAAPTMRNLDDDQYPHMAKALHDLQKARDSLMDAEPRFKGHRDRAIEHVDQAIQQCKDALAEG